MLVVTGCDKKSPDQYRVTKVDVQWVKPEREPACPSNECQMLIFTLKNKHTITAHCQAWDPKNHCFDIKIGETYDFKRAGFGLLSVEQPHVTMEIEHESM